MPAQWLSGSSAMSGRVQAALSAVLQGMAQPANARRLRQALVALLALWAVGSCARLFWALLPAPEPAAAPAAIINPIVSPRATTSIESIDIERMRSWHLFGEAGAAAAASVVVPEVAAPSAREGIEKGARETRLSLVLRGIVASTEDGLGHAIIEHQGRQAVYAVEDALPVPGRVLLAKVMPRQVVIDNGGTYELLVLFEDSALAGAVAPAREAPAAAREQVDKRGDEQAAALAADYHARLYRDPQSLAKVVNISAVREGDTLRGYRVSPGEEKQQFDQLGFKPGDLVTAVNGIALDNPANTMTLYNTLRSAGEIVFELERGEQQLSLSVSLDASGFQ